MLCRTVVFYILLLGCFFVCSLQQGGQNFLKTSGSVTLSGRLSYNNFTLSGNAIVYVQNYAGTSSSGTLEIWANYIRIDQGASIIAKGAGYQTSLCHDGSGPSSFPLSGGRGGCSVKDSGGGGAHFGSGGPGTKDCTRGGATPCWFPYDYEENCHGAVNNRNSACTNYTDCRQGNGKNQDSGLRWTHDIYSSLGMGASGGDKGCRDQDGFTYVTGGNGGGKIVLNSTGKLEVYGNVNAQGNRGCGEGNDSGGGGAGGTVILLAGTELLVGSSTYITVEGGKGGDSQPKSDPECSGTQQSGTCDDCGGGGGGGFIFVRGASGNYRTFRQAFNANGGIGGFCVVCNLRAQGEFGWIQFGKFGKVVLTRTDSDGEICNGKDDTFDGQVDELQPFLPCGISSCSNGTRLYCPPLF